MSLYFRSLLEAGRSFCVLAIVEVRLAGMTVLGQDWVICIVCRKLLYTSLAHPLFAALLALSSLQYENKKTNPHFFIVWDKTLVISIVASQDLTGTAFLLLWDSPLCYMLHNIQSSSASEADSGFLVQGPVSSTNILSARGKQMSARGLRSFHMFTGAVQTHFQKPQSPGNIPLSASECAC